eukprot:CAMPEP_0174839340 /NCGR_PEP_ID=MMETSP1114-20130205/7975_1 /TAXON_ID=312471 /ORGANISM="Neobodo designis, Strain CCAP 1951/1" /LENGTH=1065 /DNA_ID=CAMNT_0016073463 /DNA_START=42 /DNA_END=3236 /DNA_ORIENTATION=-
MPAGSPAASAEGGILSAPSGAVVGVQTACYVVHASSDGLRANKSLMVAAQNTAFEPPPSRGAQAGATALAYRPDLDTEAVHAVVPTDKAGTVNPELYFPFSCLIREGDYEEESDAAFIRRMRAEHPAVQVESPSSVDPASPSYAAAPGRPGADESDSESATGWSPSHVPTTPEDAAHGGLPDPLEMPSQSSKFEIVDPETKEKAILEAMATNAMAGMNAHLISIGGSGTMKADRMLHPDDGFAPRLLEMLFERVETAAAKDAENFRSVNRAISVSVVECFAEEFADLLTIPAKKKEEPPAESTNSPPPPTTTSKLTVTPTGPVPSALSPRSEPAASPKGGAVVPAMRTESHLTSGSDSTILPHNKRTVSFSTDLVSVAAAHEVNHSSFFSKAERYDSAALRRFVGGQSVTPSNGGLRLRQHPELGPVIEGAQELQILSVSDFLNVARGAVARRCSSGVKTNRYSHLVIKLTIRQAEVGAAAALSSVVTLVDTATAMRVPSTIPKAKKVQQSTNGLKRMITGLTEHCLSAPPSARVQPDAMGKPKRDDESSVTLVGDQLQAALAVPPEHPRHPTWAVVPNASASAVSLLAKESALTQLLSEAFLGNSFTVLLASVLDPKSIGDVGTSAMEEEGAQQTLVTLKLVARASHIATKVLPNFQPVEAKAHAIRDEIAALKSQLEQDSHDGKAADGEKTAKLQAYEDQLANIQTAFDAKLSTHAELEAQCQKQRDALNAVQSQLESRRQQAEELDAFAAEIDELLEQHRRSEARLRREREIAAEREAEAKRVARELSLMATEQDQLQTEMATVAAEQRVARQKNIAAFFKGLLEQERQKRDIAVLEQANKQLKMRCAMQQAKCDKARRAQQATQADIDQQLAVHEALRAKLKTLEEDQSVDIADTQIAQLVEVTQKATATTAATKADIEATDQETAAATQSRSAAYARGGDAVRAAHEEMRAATIALQEATKREQALQEDLAAANASVCRLTERERDLAAEVKSLDAQVDDLDAQRRKLSEHVAQTRKEREAAQEALLSASAEVEQAHQEVAAWHDRIAAAKSTYAELCSA